MSLLPVLLCLHLLVSPLSASELGAQVGRRRLGPNEEGLELGGPAIGGWAPRRLEESAPRPATVSPELSGVAAAGEQLMHTVDSVRAFANDSSPERYARLIDDVRRDDLLSDALAANLLRAAEMQRAHHPPDTAITESDAFRRLEDTAKSLLHFVEDPSMGPYRDIGFRMSRSVKPDRSLALRLQVVPFLEARPVLSELEPIDPAAVDAYRNESLGYYSALDGRLDRAQIAARVFFPSFADEREVQGLRLALQDLRLAELDYWHDRAPARIYEKLTAHQNYTTVGYLSWLSPPSLGVRPPPEAPSVVSRLLGGEIDQVGAIRDWSNLVSYTRAHPDLQDAVAFTLTNLGADPLHYREALSLNFKSTSRSPVLEFVAGEIAKDGRGRSALALLDTRDLTAELRKGALGYDDWVAAIQLFRDMRSALGEGAILAHFAASGRALPGCPEWVESASAALRGLEAPGADPDSVAFETFPSHRAVARSSGPLTGLERFLRATSEKKRDGSSRTYALPPPPPPPPPGDFGFHGYPARRRGGASAARCRITACPELDLPSDASIARAAVDLLELRARFEGTPELHQLYRPKTLVPVIKTQKRMVSLEAVVASVRHEAKGVPSAGREGWLMGVLEDLRTGRRFA